MKSRAVLTFTVSEDTITDMLDAAGYGMTGWAESMEKFAVGSNLHIAVTTHEGEVHKASYADLRAAFATLVDADQHIVNRTMHGYFISAVLGQDTSDDGEIDAGNIDADAADCLVQVALFGKLVYS